MLKEYIPSKRREVVEYELVFDDGCNNGFAFPCDSQGKLLESEEKNPAAHYNYRYCMENPERFERFNKVVRHVRTVHDNPHGICSCGHGIELYDAYYGACPCDKCGRWYNLFGQEIKPPDQWDDEIEEEPW